VQREVSLGRRRPYSDGTDCRSSPARRVSIDKPGGGTRELGIPNLLDRVIQTAIVLVLTPIKYKRSFAVVIASALYASVERFLTTQLKLTVNRDKSRIGKAEGLECVGYEFRGYGGQIRVSRKKLDTFKERASDIFRKNRGVSIKSRYAEFRSYARGWPGYFALEQVKTTFTDLDKWLRRRVRACYWKQWRKSQTRLKKLIALGVSYRVARGSAMSGKGAWRLSTTSAVQRALSNVYLETEGLFSLQEYWQTLASKRRNA
jgi:RNA-directed DNA polymerase